ncbi:MAG: hypothetical protein QOJ76_851, partial [Acidobacteriota bacterium]|nr:hypothetical protein [Acidobacteriota bacterium]
MKSRNNRPSRNAKRGNAPKRMRSVLFSLMLVSCAAAVSAGNLIPVRSFFASAQQRQEKSNDNQAPAEARIDAGGGRGAEQISESARRQIEGLMQEKATRTRGRRKMDSRLIYGIKMQRGERIADGVDSLQVKVPLTERGDVMIDITANVDKHLLAKLKAAGATILGSYPEYNSVRVAVSLDAVDAIADFPEVIYVQPKQEAMTSQEIAPPVVDQTVDPEHLRTTRPEFEERERNLSQEVVNALEEFQTNSYNVGTAGVRKSEGDKTHRTDVARNTYGVDGTGVKIGILSDGVRNLAASQASGDIGPVTVLPGQSGTATGQCAATSSCDEGTAMLEIVHDLAPGAQLFFATAFGGTANMAQNIRNLRAAGCDIIVDDVFYFAETPFQDGQAPGVLSPNNEGIVAQAVADVTAGGALYFSSAGNSGNKNDGTSGVWEGDFVDGGAATGVLAGAGRVHLFPGGSTFDTVTVAGSGAYVLNWGEPIGGATSDYDIYALNAAGTAVVSAGTSDQSVPGRDPIELMNVSAVNTRIVIVKFAGVGRFLHL